MTLRCVACALVLCIGCSRVPISDEPSPDDYCRERDAAWVRAFPEEAKSNPLMASNPTCPKIIRGEQTNETELWKRRVRCMREHIRTGQAGNDATAAYIAMSTCEGGGPQPVDK